MLNPWRIAESHEDLFVQRYNRLVGMALQLTGHDREQAEDLVHEAFVEFTLSRPDLDSINNLEGYLYGMLRNLHLSQVRRAARRHTQSLSLLDYDSAEIGLRSSDPRDRIRAKDELRDVCSYACLRKETSKAGSVLLLRFFHGYYPVEIAQVLRSPRRAVDDWLRIARREAKLYLENPRRLNPIRLSVAADALQFATGQPAGDYLGELRTTIFSSRKGSCLPLDRLRRLYLSAESDPIDCELLGHIVSCVRCLDEVNQLLGLPPLSGRFPNDMIGPDSHPHGGLGNGGRGSGDKPVKSLSHRARDVFEHSPRELRISVNGFILGSQRISAELSEQSLNINAGEKIGFVEVFSEQEIRLAFINVEAPPDGPVRQRTAVALSEGRTIELEVSFSDPWPTVHALYQDPVAARTLDTEEAGPVVSARHAPARRASFLSRWWRQIAASGILLRPGSITAVLAILLIGILTFFRIPSRPVLAAELLRRAGALEEAARADSNFVVHRALSLEERVPGSGSPISRRRIESWASGRSALKARRFYDEQGKLIAGVWSRDDGSRTIYRKGLHPEALSQETETPVSFDAASIWLFDPSARTYLSLIPRVEKATVQERSGAYVISYEDPSGPAMEIVRATLVLNRDDLHPVEQTLLVRSAAGLREYRLVESLFERLPAATIAPRVFEPDRELFIGASDRVRPAISQGTDVGVPPLAPATMSAAELVDVEAEALYQMHSVGVCLREQAEVTSVGGMLQVQAIVETEARKAEVLRALAGVMQKPAVKVDVSTFAEAAQRQVVLSSGPPKLGRVERARDQMPAYADLRSYFSQHFEDGSKVEDEAGRFSARMLGRSREALRHAWALKRHLTELSLGGLAGDGTAQSRIRAMIREHARVVERETKALRGELQPIFFARAPSVDVKGDMDGQDFADRGAAIQRLLDVSSSNEKAVRMAFALSAADQPLYIKSDQFWQALRRAEALAARLQEWQ